MRAKLGNGENLPRITPLRFGAGVDYHRGNWSSILDIFHVFDQNKSSPLEGRTNGYTLLEASINFVITRNNAEYEFSLRGRNLLDEEARLHTSFLKDAAPLPGRGLIVSLQASF